MPKEIDTLAAEAVRNQTFPGCVVAIVRKGERRVQAYGTIAYNGEPVREDTVYDVASITKSIPVSSLVLTLIDRKSLALNDLVRTWIPELQNDHAATVEDLLKYRVYGEPMSLIAHLSPKEIQRHIFQAGFSDLPGESHYSNLPAYLLGIIIERVSGKTIDVLARDEFFGPLNMHSTFFPVAGYVSDPSLSIAPTETLEDGDIHGIVHDESARVFAREGKAVGHAGLFSTAHDLATFAESLLAGGFPHVVKGAQKGLGWELNHGVFMGKKFGPRTFGKTGFTGTSIVCDTDRSLALIILSNRTYPTRPADNTAINAFRGALADIAFA